MRSMLETDGGEDLTPLDDEIQNGCDGKLNYINVTTF